jgi:hypothetical protein
MILNTESASKLPKKGGGFVYLIAGNCAFCKQRIAKFGSEEEYKEFHGQLPTNGETSCTNGENDAAN